MPHLLVERVEERDCLDGLSQPHLVRQYGVCALGPRVAQPVDPLQLVLVEGAARRIHVVRLLRVLRRQLERSRRI